MELKQLVGNITANGQQLLWPLTGLLVALYLLTFAVITFYTIKLVDGVYNENVSQELTEIISFYDDQITDQTELQELILFVLTNNPEIKEKFNTDKAFDRFYPLFERFMLNNVSHLYFISPNRTVIYRAHSPDRKGDVINRATMLKAESMQQVASGLEFGVLGTFTLRSVSPVYDQADLLGYIEVGMELGHVARKTERQFNIDLIEFFDKSLIDVDETLDFMEIAGRVSNIAADGQYLINHNPENPLTKELVQQITRQFNHQMTQQRIVGSSAITTMPLMDFSQIQVGYIAFIHDVGSLVLERNRTLGIAILVVALLAIVAIATFSYVLRYVEAVVRDYSMQNRDKAVALKKSLDDLEATQAKMVEQEKFASLGSMVAGVAHEISTPLGVSLTAATSLTEELNKLSQDVDNGKVMKSQFAQFMVMSTELSQLIERNLMRSADLLQSFKQVAVDQSSCVVRTTNFNDLLNEIVLSMKPQLKKTSHEIIISCDSDFEFETVPGYWTQIVINLISNSLIHGFDNIEQGQITITVTYDDNDVVLCYQDNGNGVKPGSKERVFEPFYTTRRDEGGSGLGMHLVYNIVSQGLNGVIKLNDTAKGVEFVISVPRLSPQAPAVQTTLAVN